MQGNVVYGKPNSKSGGDDEMKRISRRSFLERSGTGIAAVTAIPALESPVQETAHLFAPPADAALVGGKVITVNASDEIVEAVAIS